MPPLFLLEHDKPTRRPAISVLFQVAAFHHTNLSHEAPTLVLPEGGSELKKRMLIHDLTKKHIQMLETITQTRYLTTLQRRNPVYVRHALKRNKNREYLRFYAISGSFLLYLR